MIILKANSEIKNIFIKMITTMGENVKWTDIFVIKDNDIILVGKGKSLFFNFDNKRAYSNMIDLPIAEDKVEQFPQNPLLQNTLNTILYVFGKWGVIKGLKVEQNYDQLNKLIHSILEEIDIETNLSKDNFRFYKNGVQITYEEVIQAILDKTKPKVKERKEKETEDKGKKDKEKELENSQEDSNNKYKIGLWHNMRWTAAKYTFEKIELSKSEREKSRLGNNFYMVNYKCPVCGEKLFMVVYPIGKEFRIETNEEAVYMARAYTCSGCNSFYTPKPDKLLIEGEVYDLAFEDDREAYEDYLELLGRQGERTSNGNFNIYASAYNKIEQQAPESLNDVCSDLDSMSDEEISELKDKMDSGFYPKKSVGKYLKRIAKELRNRKSKDRKNNLKDRDTNKEKEPVNNEKELITNEKILINKEQRNSQKNNESEIKDNKKKKADIKNTNIKESKDKETSKGTSSTIILEKQDIKFTKNVVTETPWNKKIKTGNLAKENTITKFVEKLFKGISKNDKKESNETKKNINVNQKFKNEKVLSEKAAFSETETPEVVKPETETPEVVKPETVTPGAENPNKKETIPQQSDMDITSTEVEGLKGIITALLKGIQTPFIEEIEKLSPMQLTALKTLIQSNKELAQKDNYIDKINKALNKEKEKELIRKAVSGKEKNYSGILQLVDEIKAEDFTDSVKKPVLESLMNLLKLKGKKEIEQIISNLPENISRQQYIQVRDEIDQYKEIDSELPKKYLEEKRNAAEIQEITAYMKQANGKDRNSLSDLYNSLKEQGFEEKNVSPFLEKIQDKIYSMDEGAINKICPDPTNISFAEGLEAYEMISSGNYLPELKVNILGLIDKRLVNLKMDECEQLVKKLSKDLAMVSENNPNIYFYDPRKMVEGNADDAESRIIRKALNTYVTAKGKYEYPLLICDSSVSSKGKEGFVLTPDHIFYNSLIHSGILDIMDIGDVTAENGLFNKGVFVKDKNNVKVKISNSLKLKKASSFAEMLNEFTNYLKEKPESRNITYLAKEKHAVKCCYRCGYVYKGGNICPKCGSKNND